MWPELLILIQKMLLQRVANANADSKIAYISTDIRVQMSYFIQSFSKTSNKEPEAFHHRIRFWSFAWTAG
jgi:hypothetical protein